MISGTEVVIIESLSTIVVSPSNMFTFIPKFAAICLIFGNWSRANALVGYTKTANTFSFPLIFLDLNEEKCGISSEIFCIIGIQKASVLPEAVGATITTSFPLKTCLIDSS